MDHNDLAVTSKSAKAQDRAELADVLKNGAYVFFMKSGSGPTRLEIWIHDQRIFVFDKHKLLIGRSDIQKGIIPDIDLTPYLAEYALKISRKQAWLTETNGRWFISLDENAHSPVFLNGKQPLEVGESYEILDYARLGFGGSLDQSFFAIFTVLFGVPSTGRKITTK
ncbi:MAG: hypothetical protein IPN29_02380 [Saprospiraceae bacterium]|nr:hypothetical protein [Saprospiraceae bacterium]